MDVIYTHNFFSFNSHYNLIIQLQYSPNYAHLIQTASIAQCIGQKRMTPMSMSCIHGKSLRVNIYCSRSIYNDLGHDQYGKYLQYQIRMANAMYCS